MRWTRNNEASFFELQDDCAYGAWIAKYDGWSFEDEAGIRELMGHTRIRPFFAVVPLALGPVDKAALTTLVGSLQAQTYDRWYFDLPLGVELDLQDPRVRNSTAESSGPAAALSAAVSISAVDYVIPLPVDAILTPQALSEFVFAIAARADAELLYGDEDIQRGPLRTRPQFKTNWDPFFMLGRDLIGTPACYRRQTLEYVLGPFCADTVDNLCHELSLRFASVVQPEYIVHVPAVLCHRTGQADWCGETARKVVEEFLGLAGYNHAKISPAPLAPQWNRIEWPLPEKTPLVSIIVPTRDNAELIRRCVDGLLNRTDYPNLELLIIDNGTQEPAALEALANLARDPRVEIIRDDRPFNFSALNNVAAEHARGELLLLLNNDTEVLHSNWLRELVSTIRLPGVGIVGAKLLYFDRRIQHAGIGFGPDNSVSHVLRYATEDDIGPLGELALLRQVSAVTAACLMVRRNVFCEANGLDERFAVAYSDVDFCRKVARLGYSILMTPHARLLHLEATSRGLPDCSCEHAAREFKEMSLFWQLNPEFYEQYDPFLSPNIVFEGATMCFANPPRRARPWRSRHVIAKPFFY